MHSLIQEPRFQINPVHTKRKKPGPEPVFNFLRDQIFGLEKLFHPVSHRKSEKCEASNWWGGGILFLGWKKFS